MGKPGSKETTLLCSMSPWAAMPDGAEMCELVGLYIIDKLKASRDSRTTSLYIDDSLAAFRNIGPRTADRLRKKFNEE